MSEQNNMAFSIFQSEYILCQSSFIRSRLQFSQKSVSFGDITSLVMKILGILSYEITEFGKSMIQ